MAEQEKRHPTLNNVFTVVTNENPGVPPEEIVTVLTAVSDFYRKISIARERDPDNRPDIPEPDAFEHPIFQRKYKTLPPSSKGLLPVALRVGVEADIPFQRDLAEKAKAEEERQRKADAKKKKNGGRRDTLENPDQDQSAMSRLDERIGAEQPEGFVLVEAEDAAQAEQLATEALIEEVSLPVDEGEIDKLARLLFDDKPGDVQVVATAGPLPDGADIVVLPTSQVPTDEKVPTDISPAKASVPAEEVVLVEPPKRRKEPSGEKETGSDAGRMIRFHSLRARTGLPTEILWEILADLPRQTDAKGIVSLPKTEANDALARAHIRRVDPKTHEYVAPDEAVWIPRDVARVRLGLSHAEVDEAVVGLSTQRVIGGKNRVADFYNEADLRARVEVVRRERQIRHEAAAEERRRERDEKPKVKRIRKKKTAPVAKISPEERERRLRERRERNNRRKREKRAREAREREATRVLPDGFISRTDAQNLLAGFSTNAKRTILAAVTRQGKGIAVTYHEAELHAAIEVTRQNLKRFEANLARGKVNRAQKERHAALPHADTETLIYTAPDGQTYLPRSLVHTRLGSTYSDAQTVIASTAPFPVVARNNRTREYFNEAQLREQYAVLQQQRPAKTEKPETEKQRAARMRQQEKAKLPHADPVTKICTTPEGHVLLPANLIMAHTGIPDHAKRRIVKEMTGTPVVSSRNTVYPFYDEAEIRARYAVILQERRSAKQQRKKAPRVRTVSQTQRERRGRRAEYETVAQGATYLALVRLHDKYPDLSMYRLEKLLAGLPTLQGLSGNYKPIPLFSEAQADAQIAEYERKKSGIKESAPKKRSTRPPVGEWPSEKELAQEFGLTVYIVKTVLASDPSRLWNRQRLHQRIHAEPKIIAHLEKRRLEAGIVIVDGKLRAPLNYFYRRFGMSFPTLRKHFEGLETVEGLAHVPVYVIDEAMARLGPHLELPEADPKTLVVTKPDGRSVATQSRIGEMLGLSHDKMATYTLDMPFDDIKVHGQPARGYDVAHVKARASFYLSLPEIGDRIGDKKPEQLLDAATLAREFDLDVKFVRYKLSDIAVLVRGKTGNGYPDTTARKELARFVSLPEIDEQTQSLTDPGGEVYVMGSYAKRELSMNVGRFPGYEEAGLLRGMPARVGGMETRVYSLRDLVNYKNNPPPKAKPVRRKPLPAPIPRDVKQAGLLAEARTAYQQLGDLKGQQMRDAGFSGLVKRLTENFDGGMPEVRVRLGIEKPDEQYIRWAEMDDPTAFILKSVQTYIKTHKGPYTAGDVIKILSELGIDQPRVNNLYQVKEPGLTGYAQLQKDLGFAPGRIDWNKMEEEYRNDYIELIAQGFLDNDIALTTAAIKPYHSTFVRQVNRYYTRGSGGMKGLQERKGVVDARVNWAQVTDVPAKIRELIRAQLGDKPLKTTNLTGTAVSWVYNKYPGAWVQFVQDYERETQRLQKAN